MLRRCLAICVGMVLMAAPATAQDLTLRGVLTGRDHQSYRELPFRVPPGVRQLTVEFGYTGKDQRAVIDLGLRDPQRFRGWSGGNKARFTLAETFATASYLPGPLLPGEWKLILGVPNLRNDGRAEYEARITFRRDDRFPGFAQTPLKAGPGWYRGDLHMHTAHSDGSCAAQSGASAPCPLAKTLEAAAARGLDFVAVTEHNATSHHQALAELQPHFDRLLLIPGREITTFKGHFNVVGVVEPLDFQLGGPRAPALGDILGQVERAGGFAFINHPALPSGEACMGCGWTAGDDPRLTGVEAVNGSALAQPAAAVFSGLPFWEKDLNGGRRRVAVGGSDNHDAKRPPALHGAVGRPTTVVWAEQLSQPAILAGLTSGRVFIDVEGAGRLLDVTARTGARTAPMGGTLEAAAGAQLALDVRVVGAAGGRLTLRGPAADLLEVRAGAPLGADETIRQAWSLGEGRSWVRLEVHGPDGQLWLLGNPIYINWAGP